MRAVVYRSVGAPEVIEVAEIDLPEPGMFEIRIKVDAAALNPADVAAWSGMFPAPPDGSHFGLGWDVAGPTGPLVCADDRALSEESLR